MGEPLHEMIGRTRLARAPVASAAAATSIPVAPSSEPATKGLEAADPPPAEFVQPTSPGGAVEASEEERAILCVLRLIDRAGGLQPLSPVERALVEGARVTFDRLAKACKALLDRKASDLLSSIADPTQPPTAAPAPGAPRGPNRGRR